MEEASGIGPTLQYRGLAPTKSQYATLSGAVETKLFATLDRSWVHRVTLDGAENISMEVRYRIDQRCSACVLNYHNYFQVTTYLDIFSKYQLGLGRGKLSNVFVKEKP